MVQRWRIWPELLDRQAWSSFELLNVSMSKTICNPTHAAFSPVPTGPDWPRPRPLSICPSNWSKSDSPIGSTKFSTHKLERQWRQSRQFIHHPYNIHFAVFQHSYISYQFLSVLIRCSSLFFIVLQPFLHVKFRLPELHGAPGFRSPWRRKHASADFGRRVFGSAFWNSANSAIQKETMISIDLIHPFYDSHNIFRFWMFWDESCHKMWEKSWETLWNIGKRSVRRLQRSSELQPRARDARPLATNLGSSR